METGADLRPLHRRALEVAGGVVSEVEPMGLSLPTPCVGWDLHTLLGHIIGQNHGFAEAVGTAEAPRQAFADRRPPPDGVQEAWTRGTSPPPSGTTSVPTTPWSPRPSGRHGASRTPAPRRTRSGVRPGGAGRCDREPGAARRRLAPHTCAARPAVDLDGLIAGRGTSGSLPHPSASRHQRTPLPAPRANAQHVEAGHLEVRKSELSARGDGARRRRALVAFASYETDGGASGETAAPLR